MRFTVILLFSAFLFSCGNSESNPEKKAKELPVLGREPIESFGFIDQNGDTITEKDVEGKIWVVDFFFTTCPTICPKMKSEMLRVAEAFQNEERVKILSHTIDPEHDTREVLKDFADRLEVKGNQWHFLTGDKDSIYGMAERYMVSAAEDASAPGGFIHSGAFVLLDGNRNIRGYYDGTRPQSVDTMIADMKSLLK
jgi:protein SCO1/2